ncbi:MAG: Bug family tripartite tricarboxylate transporter substrate binding protein [Lautropia sp.]
MPVESRRLFTAVATLAVVSAVALATPVRAQSWPDKPIRLLIPFTPGGGTDFVSRLVGSKLAESAGWTVVMENKPGAGGNIAIAAAAQAPADGYTIVMGQSDNMMLGPWLYPNVGYDSVESFAPIVQVSVAPLVIASAANSKLTGPAEMIAAGKAGQGITWATAGNGTLGHLFGEQLRAATGMKLTQVPYKGAAPAVADVIGGQVDTAILSTGSVLPQIRAGKLRAVAVTSAQRSPMLPDTPTIDEAGQKGVDVKVWLGLFAPKGTSPDIVAKINAEVNKVLQMADVKDKLAKAGIAPAGGTSAAFAEFVKNDYAHWGKVAKASGVKLQ